MPPSADFFLKPSSENEAAAAEWQESKKGKVGFACKITLAGGETILGELEGSLNNLGIGSLRIPYFIGKDRLATKNPAEQALFTQNQQLFESQATSRGLYQKLGLNTDINCQVGEFLCSVSAGGRSENKDTHVYELYFFRRYPEDNGRFRRLAGYSDMDSEANKRLLLLSVQGLSEVIERNFGWKVEPLNLSNPSTAA